MICRCDRESTKGNRDGVGPNCDRPISTGELCEH